MGVQVSLRVISLESRRELEMASLLERRGMVPIRAPSMREVALGDQVQALDFGRVLLAGGCDGLVLLTGVGARRLFDVLEAAHDSDRVREALSRLKLLCRGPKPAAVLRAMGLRATAVAPEPNTYRELLALCRSLGLAGQRLWVQEYGRPNDALLSGLKAQGAEVHRVPIYAWRLPEDTAPLERAVELLCRGEADAVTVTSARQIDHLLQVAERLGLREQLMAALGERVLVASIGPVTSEALRDHGLEPDLEPEHPKMGQLVKALDRDAMGALEHKRASHTGEP
ncbi:MAG: uroporphyrinogen-III synthase [Myxococcales bacterium]|nr:uroporphyrinogen-III synthase [Myxococcales bacterium]